MLRFDLSERAPIRVSVCLSSYTEPAVGEKAP